MAMANSVEGRFPFLDHRIVEFASQLPPTYKMKVLNEKYILKKAMRGLLPESIKTRKKQPYMAPDILSFFGEGPPEYLEYYLSDKMIADTNIFKPKAVKQLIAKCAKNTRQGFRENMAFVGILSTQILYNKFIRNFKIDIHGTLPNTKVLF